MKSIIVLCLFGFLALALAKPDGGLYTDRYDNFNIQDVLNNKRLFKNYCNCLLDLGKCTPEGKELKSHISEALEQNCAKCTPAQRQGTETVMAHMINNEPECWEQLKAKYDSTGKHAIRYEQEYKKLKG